MTRIDEVHYASREGAAGSADLFEANPFLQRGSVKVVSPEQAEGVRARILWRSKRDSLMIALAQER